MVTLIQTPNNEKITYPHMPATTCFGYSIQTVTPTAYEIDSI